jgi:hypothetical protein
MFETPESTRQLLDDKVRRYGHEASQRRLAGLHHRHRRRLRAWFVLTARP